MSDSIGSILAQRNLSEPPEIKIIQDYVEKRFKVVPKVTVGNDRIAIGVKSASLAGALRPHLLQIQAACNTDKSLIIRIQ